MQPSILKWLGGKRTHLPYLREVFAGEREILVEPFVGSGIVFLNTDFKEYVLGDKNPDLVGLYLSAMKEPDKLLAEMAPHFKEGFSNEYYLAVRNEFNQLPSGLERRAMFVYLNRFGFNGLCRYNLKGGFNVPFGKYTNPERPPLFPEAAVLAMAEKASRCKVTLICEGFEFLLENIEDHANTVVYADPPYVPISETANFVGYTGQGFGIADQMKLADMLRVHYECGGLSVLSNSSTEQTMQIFHHPNTRTYLLNVKRPIAASAESRGAVQEILSVLGDNFPVLTKEQSATNGARYLQRYVDEHQLDECVFWFEHGLSQIRMAPGRWVPKTPGKSIGWCKDVDAVRHGSRFFYRVIGGQVHIEYL